MIRPYRSGYTLLEALVAAVILVLVLPFLTRWVLAGRQAQVGSLRSDLAISVASRSLDSIAQVPRATRDPSLFQAGTLSAGSPDTMRWGYMEPGAPYASTNLRPGAAWVEVRWKAGAASRLTRLEGVLP